MAGSARDKIKLVSSAGTGHYYTTTKNKRNTPDKMAMKKYDPVVRKHVLYKEAKIKPPEQPGGTFLPTPPPAAIDDIIERLKTLEAQRLSHQNG